MRCEAFIVVAFGDASVSMLPVLRYDGVVFARCVPLFHVKQLLLAFKTRLSAFNRIQIANLNVMRECFGRRCCLFVGYFDV